MDELTLQSCILFPSIFAPKYLDHYITPTSIPPPHRPTSPPKSHVAIAIATAHAACLLAATSLCPLAFSQGDAVVAMQPGNQARELCQKWGSYRGREEGREAARDGGGGHCGSVSYCPVVLCNFMYTHPRTITVG